VDRDLVARSRDAGPLLRRAGSPHPGLVFERFPRVLSLRGGHYELAPGARLEWLDEFVRLAGETTERATRLREVHARLDTLAQGGLRRELRTAWRFVSGLGNPSATQTGMSFDFACGVPCLPASSVKGLARAGAGLEEAAGDLVADVLGRRPQSDDVGAAGPVVFLDALPLRWPKLDIDIITRHHDPEALPTQAVPLDTDQPNPVHFLTVAAGQLFVFRLLRGRDAAPDALEVAWRWLASALEVLGAGGKTAVGYGQMVAM
jgi:CRISPR-associated protein Cmr6